MKIKKPLVFNLFLGVVVASLFFSLASNGLLKRVELASLDFLFRAREQLRWDPRIVIVEITDTDILEVGRWPWKRSWHASLTRVLSDLGAKAIYFDILFSEASSEEDDAVLEEALRSSGKVYLPFAFEGMTFDTSRTIPPLKRFLPYLRGVDAMNSYPDIDGITRRIRLVFVKDGIIYPHVALQIAMDDMGMKIKDIGPDSLVLAGNGRSVRIPLDEDKNMLINWAGKWQNTFKHYDYLDILSSYKDMQDGKKPGVDISGINGSICLVGVSAVGLYDIKPTPVQPEFPGIGIMAMAINTLIKGNFLRDPPGWVDTALIIFFALIPALLISGEKPVRETALVFTAGGVYFLADLLLFKNGLRMHLFTHLLCLFSSYITIGGYNFIRVSIERREFLKMSVTDGLTGLYNIRYFRMVLDTEFMLTRAGHYQKFSLIMGDIDHFKKFNDTYGHQVGDLILKEIASTLINSVRSLDILARYGGEEMIVLLRGASLKDSLAIAEKLRKNVENARIRDAQRSYSVTMSFGVASFRKGDTVDSLIKRSDESLYKAKEGGRNRVCSVDKE
ncbi:MAG: CHASE2 domain-containing protein [Candidatus Omnitrophica bacterium]|nr:CHASE2 domain-containing protein [Candidatus Omnitrophota bacterium]